MKDGDCARFMDGGSDEREGKGRDKNWIETRLVSRPPIYLGDVVGLLHMYNLEAKTSDRPSDESCQKRLGA